MRSSAYLLSALLFLLLALAALATTDPNATVSEGFFTLSVDNSTLCAQNLTMRLSDPNEPQFSLDGVFCTTTKAALFRDLRADPRLPAKEILTTLGIGALLTATLPAGLICGPRSLQAGTGLVYARIDSTAGVLLKPGILAFLASDEQLRPFLPALESVDVSPGVLIASTDACAWRRAGDASMDTEGSTALPSTSRPPTPTPSPSTNINDSVDLAACFPADATAQLRDGLHVRMADLRTGDQVHVGEGEYSPILMWTHQDGTSRGHDFVRVSLANGNVLTVSPGHYLYATTDNSEDGTDADAAMHTKLITAKRLTEGMNMFDERGRGVTVNAVDRVTATGLYNPQTAHGDIVVDGVRCSTYTTAVPPAAAHALLTPVRAAFCAMRWLTLGNGATRTQMT